MGKITLEDLANSFGTDIEDIKENCIDIINGADLTYTFPNEYERDQIILNILKKIDEDKQITGSPERKNIWNNGWEENYQEFINSNYDLDKLVPKFIRCCQPVRHNQELIKPLDNKFWLNYYCIHRQWLFKKYLSNYDHIYEFGCGTGFNLVALAQLYPDKKLYGLDFVHSSINMINKIEEHYKYNINGHLFDMTDPDPKFKLHQNSAVLTMSSIEQLAGKFEKFIQYLLTQKISLCVHAEPTIELCNKDNLLDYLAIKFSTKRRYTTNLLSYLRKLELDNIIKIIEVKRLSFGTLYVDGYNHIIWRPIRS